MKKSIRATGAVVALAALITVPATEAKTFGSGFKPAFTTKGGKSGSTGSKLELDLLGKGGKGNAVLQPRVKPDVTINDPGILNPGLVTPEIEVPTVDDIVKPKKIRCRAVKNRRGEWRVRGRGCKRLLPPKNTPEIRFDVEDCLVEVDRLGNRYLIGDDCPDEPVEIPEDESRNDLPDVDCTLMVETEGPNGVPIWTPTQDGCDDPFDVGIPAPEIPEDFGNRCPEDYFHPSQYIDEVKFAMPVHDEYGFPFPHPILHEPGVIHMDHDLSDGDSDIDCETYDGQHLCYDGHEGTDFMLAGHFLAMDNANVSARAAAAGRVMRVRDGNFDRCQVDIDPNSDTFGDVICPNPDADNTSINPPNKVEICHPDGTISSYLHLMDGTMQVIEGQSVSCGEPLALIGSSGQSAAPHLHFHVRQKNENGNYRYVDPYTEDEADSMWVDQNGGAPFTLPSAQCQ